VLTAPAEKKLLARLKLGKSRWLRLWKIALTFLFVCFAWIFFRANTLEEAWYVISHLFTGLDQSLAALFTDFPSLAGINAFLRPLVDQVKDVGPVISLFLVGMVILSIINHRVGGRAFLWRLPALARWALYYLLAGAILFLGLYGQSQFIYFQF